MSLQFKKSIGRLLGGQTLLVSGTYWETDYRQLALHLNFQDARIATQVFVVKINLFFVN